MDLEIFFQPGDVVYGRYEVVRPLGAGAFGQVFHVVDVRDRDRHYALKVVELDGADSNSSSARQEVAALRLLGDEADNFNCIRLVDEFNYQNNACIVLPLMGVDLNQLLQTSDRRKMPMSLLKPLVQKLCTAVAHLHSQGIAHTDLKLNNIVLSSRCVETLEQLTVDNCGVRVIDFGCSTFDDHQTDVTVSTRPFRAPENLAHKNCCRKSDVWSLALIIFSLYSGEDLFSFDSGIDEVKREWLDTVHLASIEELLRERIPEVTRESRVKLQQDFRNKIPKDFYVSMRFVLLVSHTILT